MESYPILKWTLIVIAGAIIASLLEEVGNAMTGVIVQNGWCASGDSVCVLRTYSIAGLSVLLLAAVVDFFRNRVNSRRQQIGNGKNDLTKLVFGASYIEPWDINRIELVEGPQPVFSTTSSEVTLMTREFDTASFQKSRIAEVKRLAEYDIAFVEVSLVGAEEAKGVTARPSFYTLKGKQIGSASLFSRWWEKDERPTGEKTFRDLRAIDIQEANPARLAFAFKPENDSSMYAYDHTAHSPNVRELKAKGTELGIRPVFAKVSASGRPNIGPSIQWFMLKIGQSGRLIVRNISPPKWSVKHTSKAK